MFKILIYFLQRQGKTDKIGLALTNVLQLTSTYEVKATNPIL